MKKLNICIDIDGTVTEPYYWIETANEYFDKAITGDDVTVYEIPEVLDISLDEYYAYYDKHGYDIHYYAKPREHAKEVVNKYFKNNNIHFVTAREDRMEKVSKIWLKNNGFKKNSLTLLGSHNKIETAKKLKCDIFIEDRYENAVDLSKAGFNTILIDCTYNQGKLPENAIRVKTWDEIDTIIQEYIENQEYGFSYA